MQLFELLKLPWELMDALCGIAVRNNHIFGHGWGWNLLMEEYDFFFFCTEGISGLMNHIEEVQILLLCGSLPIPLLCSAFSLPSFISPSQECSARASPSASLSNPKQHIILVKSQVTQCSPTLSSSVSARQEEGTVRNRRQKGKAQNGTGWCGALHIGMKSWKRGEENYNVLLRGILMDCPGESPSQWGGHGFPGPFARNYPKILGWYFI